MEQKHAVIFGATGLIGGHLLLSLLGDGRYSKVTVIGRSLPDNDHPKLVRTRLALEALDDFVLEASVDEVFCCLGSTMKQRMLLVLYLLNEMIIL